MPDGFVGQYKRDLTGTRVYFLYSLDYIFGVTKSVSPPPIWGKIAAILNITT